MFISARRGLWVRPVRMLPAKGAGACRWHHYTCFARECKARGNPCRMEVHQKCRRADECVPAGPGRRGVPQTDRRAFRPAHPDIIRREPANTRRIPPGRPGGAAAPPLREWRRRGAKPSSDWGDASKGAKPPLDCNRIPGLCPGGGSFSALRKTFLTASSGREPRSGDQREAAKLLNCQVKCNSWLKKTSKGDLQPRHLRGRRLILLVKAVKKAESKHSKSVDLGQYSRMSPLVFSFVPRIQGA